MSDLAKDTEVEACAGGLRARLSSDWDFWGPYGGYLAAIALRAAGASTPLRRPATIACHYLNTAAFDDVLLTVSTLRATKRTASLRVSMTQGDLPILEALVWVVDDGPGLEHDAATMPDVPPAARLQSLESLLTQEELARRSPMQRNLESRPVGWTHWRDRKPGPPVWREWHRYRSFTSTGDPFVEAARALLLADLVLPAVRNVHGMNAPFMTPNIDLAVQFHRSAPDSEWLLCDSSAPVASHGLVGGRVQVWSSEGQLLVTGSGQLVCRPAKRQT